MTEEQIQQKYIELQLLDQQIKQIQEQMMALDTQILEMQKLTESLDEIKKIKKGSEIFVPLGSGIFVKANLQDTKEVLMNVGSDVSVKKTIPDSKEVIKNQIEQMQNLMKQLGDALQQAAIQTQALQQEITESTKKK